LGILDFGFAILDLNDNQERDQCGIQAKNELRNLPSKSRDPKSPEIVDLRFWI
jgi:hypothetical protein